MIVDYSNRLTEWDEVPGKFTGEPAECASGVYETMLVAGGLIVQRDEHLDRFEKSVAELYGGKLPKRDILKLRIYRLLTESEPSLYGKLRISYFPPEEGDKPTIVITLADVDADGLAKLRDGGKTLVSAAGRSFGDVKFNHKRLGAELAAGLPDGLSTPLKDVLVLNERGEVCELFYGNIFGVKGKILVTPMLESPCLPGIVRGWVMQNASEWGYQVEERELKLADLPAFDELFSTSAISGVVPIIGVDSVAVKNGEPGEITREIQQRFDEFVNEV